MCLFAKEEKHLIKKTPKLGCKTWPDWLAMMIERGCWHLGSLSFYNVKNFHVY
jgi:hypothetical protein